MSTSVVGGRNYKFGAIDPELLDEVWLYVLPWIRRSLRRTGLPIGPIDIWDDIRAGRTYLWLVTDEHGHVRGVITTEIVDYGIAARVCRVMIISGENFNEWRRMASLRIEAWARANGAFAMEAIGRRGFERKHSEDEGWRPFAVMYRKEL